MLPFILAGAAALLFATGCHVVLPSQSPPLQDNLRQPKSRRDTEDGSAANVYVELKSAGVEDSQMDQGCRIVDFGKPGPNERLIGAKDGEVWPCEAYRHAVNHYEKFAQIVEGIAQGPIPWSLDDRDPSTSLDEKLRGSLSRLAASIQSSLIIEGYDPHSAEYQKRMAVALFFWAVFPKDRKFIEANRPVLLKATEELRHLGMVSFQEDLFRSGGLGISDWSTEEQDGDQELSALQALKYSRGKCMVRSKLLFGLFRHVGLNPFFVRTDYLGMKNQLKGMSVPFYLQIPLFSETAAAHVYVGVKITGAKPRYFDPMVGIARADYDNYYPIELSHFLASDLSNRAVTYYLAGFESRARPLILQSLRLAPNDPFIGSNHDLVFLQEGLRLAFP